MDDIRAKYNFNGKDEEVRKILPSDKKEEMQRSVRNIMTKFYEEHKGGIKSLIEKQNEKEFN
jgi:hypothetical protein